MTHVSLQPPLVEEKHGHCLCSLQPRWVLYPKKADHISRKQGRKPLRSIEKNLDTKRVIDIFLNPKWGKNMAL